TEPVGLTIYNQLGAVIFKTEQGISDKASLDLSCAPKGLYVVKVDGNNEFLTRKIVLE
ncbi:MAG: T9SS type A sorting domain-containing protein, partial [Prolixibacteraceae bacterium]|nr:T9SS type A sorting domain-containing protein [Prolixibacteraceae bacterium]